MCGYNYTRKHTAEVAANWLKPDMKRTTTFLWRPRKVWNEDGWSWGGSWAIVGADNEWHNFDKDYFYQCLGIEIKPCECDTLAATLQRHGFKVHDETLAVTVIF